MSTTAGGIDFDAWRQAYASATFEQHQDFYSRVWREYQVQQHWEWVPFREAMRRLLELDARPFSVVELGGWRGELAVMALAHFPHAISKWTNLDICREAIEHSVHADERYEGVALHAHVWDDPSQVPEADVAVATHTFEHLSLEHVLAAVRSLNPSRALYVEIPIREGPTSWDNYLGSHILEVGWLGLEAALRELGYERDEEMYLSSCRLYLRRGRDG